MSQRFGQEIFNKGYKIVKQAEKENSGKNLEQSLQTILAEMLPSDLYRKEFITYCLSRIYSERMTRSTMTGNLFNARQFS